MGIPLEQGGVFRRDIHLDALLEDEFQSLWNRAGSFDKMEQFKDRVIAAFQSLWNRARSFDSTFRQSGNRSWFQSLWSRAGSFDEIITLTSKYGNEFQSLWSRAGSFDKCSLICLSPTTRFNPFRAGRGLSTYLLILNDVLLGFNPFGAGRGLSTGICSISEELSNVSQSL